MGEGARRPRNGCPHSPKFLMSPVIPRCLLAQPGQTASLSWVRLSPLTNQALLAVQYPYMPFMHPSRPTLTQVPTDATRLDRAALLLSGSACAGPWFKASPPTG